MTRSFRKEKKPSKKEKRKEKIGVWVLIISYVNLHHQLVQWILDEMLIRVQTNKQDSEPDYRWAYDVWLRGGKNMQDLTDKIAAINRLADKELVRIHSIQRRNIPKAWIKGKIK